MTAKTERITILGTPDFKQFLKKEAQKEGISLSSLVRRRCAQSSVTQDEEMIAELLAELKAAAKRAERSLDRGIEGMQQALAEIRERKAA